jgi:Mycothiol maleylpyruvate isomerase N-terminal domain
MDERDYVVENRRELERMRTLADGLSEQNLILPVNEFWTVAGVFGHIAFWDARILALAHKVDRGEPFTESDTEPEDVDWINDATRPLIHAVPPVELIRLSLRIAQDTDDRVATLPPERMWPQDPNSPIYCVRADHRGEHLDDVEAALRAR